MSFAFTITCFWSFWWYESTRDGFVVRVIFRKGDPGMTPGVTLHPGPRKRTLEGWHHGIWVRGRPIKAVLSRVTRATTPLQFSDGFVTDFVLWFKKCPIPAGKNTLNVKNRMNFALHHPFALCTSDRIKSKEISFRVFIH